MNNKTIIFILVLMFTKCFADDISIGDAEKVCKYGVKSYTSYTSYSDTTVRKSGFVCQDAKSKASDTIYN